MIETAVILAGGMGTRLQSVISDLPKPMAPVNGEPFLSYQLLYLKHFGVSKVVLSVGHLHEKIMSYFGSHYEGIAVNYSIERETLGTGGGIRLALEQCPAGTVLALNGDSFFEMDLAAFVRLHQQSGAKVSLALRQVTDAARYGTIITDQKQRIVSFREKSGISGPGTINAGIYLLDKNTFFESTEEGTNFSIEKDFFEKQLDQIKPSGFEFEGYFIDIGIPKDYHKAQHDLKGFKYR